MSQLILPTRYAFRFLKGFGLLYVVGQIIAHYETAYAPFNRHRLAQIGNVLMNVSYKLSSVTLSRLRHFGTSQREALTKRELAAIRQPCLLIHGDKNQIHPIQHAFNMVADLVNSKDDAKMYTIKGIFGFGHLVCMARMVTPLLI